MTKLLYSKVTWWTSCLNIHSIIVDVVSEEYLIYYMDILLTILFLIGHWPFLPYLAYISVHYYSIGNPKNSWLDNKDKQIYREIHIAD